MTNLFILLPVYIMVVFANTAYAREWGCNAIPGNQYDYKCPTTECRLVSDDYHGLRLGMPIPDAYFTFCRAVENGAFYGNVLADYEIPNNNNEKEVVLTPNFCGTESEIDRLTGWIAGVKTPELSPLITRLLILSDGARITNIIREVRCAECNWERGL